MRGQVQEAGLDSTRLVARNTFLLVLGLLSGRVLALFVLKKMTPLLGPDGVGIWGLATDLTTILLVIANFGLGTLVTREVARDRPRTFQILWSSLLIRWAMGALCYLFLLLYVRVEALEPVARSAVLVTGLAVFVEATAMACDAVLQAHDKVEYQTWGQLASAVVYFGLAWVLLDAGAGVMGVIWANLLSRVVRLAVMAPLMFLKTGPWRWRARPGEAAAPVGAGVRAMLTMAWPLFLATTFGILYYKVDTVMLMGYLGQTAVGIYVLGHRALDTLTMGPTLFATALFPAMARYGREASADVTRMGERALRYMMVSMLPLTLLVVLAGAPIIRWFAEAGAEAGFQDSITVLKIVLWGLPFVAAVTIFQRVLIAAGRERDFIAVSLAAMAVNVSLNAALIPRFSYYGAGVATIFGLAANTGMTLFFLRRARASLPLGRAVGGSLAALLIAWAGSLGAVRLLEPGWFAGWLDLPTASGTAFLTSLGLFCLLYAAAVAALRVLGRDDLTLLRQLVRRRAG